MKAFLIKDYANMSDRVVKPISSTSLTYDYLYTDMTSAISGYTYQAKEGVNIDTKDGIETSFVVNWDEDWAPNFCYVTGGPSSEYNPVSGWYVTEFKKIRGKQYQVGLHRDVVGDKYRKIKDAPCYIERGIVQQDSPLIYNSEGMTLNQIKQDETLLKDKLDGYYYVGYISKDLPDTTITGAIVDFPYESISASSPLIPYLKGTSYHSIITNKFYCADEYNLKFGIGRIGTNIGFDMKVYRGGNISLKAQSGVLNTDYPSIVDDSISTYTQEKITGIFNIFKGKIINNYDSIVEYIYDAVEADLQGTYQYCDWNNFQNLSNYNNKIIHDNFVYSEETSDEYFNYVMNRGEYGGSAWHNDQTSGTPRNLTLLMRQLLKDAIDEYTGEGSTASTTNYSLRYQVNSHLYNYDRTAFIPNVSYTVTIPSSRQHCQDAPYDIIVIPCGVRYGGIHATQYVDDGIAKSLAQQICKIGYSGSNPWLYDMQKVPYATLNRESYVTNRNALGPLFRYPYHYINISNITTTKPEIVFITSGTQTEPTAHGVMCFPSSKEDSFNIDVGLAVRIEDYAMKCENECDFYRITSPNGAGSYEFNLAKNGGFCATMNVDVTLKPLMPYFHVNPDFGGLYKTDYNDYRGLVCGGNFSIAAVTDSWLSYTANNKMFAQIFDRQIQNLDFNQKYQMLGQQLGAITSTIGTGVGAGLLSGNPVVGVGAGVASGIGGIADTEILKKQQKESKDYTIDMFNLNLRNVQAQPNTLTKIGAEDYNNKIWVTLEHYSCTDEEREAFKKKIQYNSMTVNVISTIGNFKQNEISFIQGRLIRCDNLGENDRFVTVLKNEIMKGVYL